MLHVTLPVASSFPCRPVTGPTGPGARKPLSPTRKTPEAMGKNLLLCFWFLWAISVSAFWNLSGAQAADEAADEDTYSQNEIVAAVAGFFGTTSEAAGAAVERIFKDHGRPNAYIKGEEVSGAIGVGLRYGKGTIHFKNGLTRKVYWQGPSAGFDFGGNASKSFVLVYNLADIKKLYQRFPGVEGSYYFVAGIGVNYQQSDDIILAPMRTGVGLRAGANIGYLKYSKKRKILPF